jgi:uncharacterized protein YjbI with pentapeptide repeats
MTERLRSWWQKLSKPLMVVAITILVVGLLALVIFGYLLRLAWTGFFNKTLWDWLQLLIIPAVLAVGGYLFNFAASRNEREIASDKQREDALQAYIDKISELLLKEHLGELKLEYEKVRKIARVRTLTILRGLDAERKGSVIQFLHESGLISKDKHIINLSRANLSRANLSGADLSGADLSGASLMRANMASVNLSEANLSGADLSEANLFQADLRGANLDYADLSGADLFEADLRGALLLAVLFQAKLREATLSGVDLSGTMLIEADLSGANLSGANLTQEQWERVKSLQGAIMPDESTHP